MSGVATKKRKKKARRNGKGVVQRCIMRCRVKNNHGCKWVLPARSVKNLPAMQETWVQSLHREDPLEKEMATYSSVLAWRIP